MKVCGLFFTTTVLILCSSATEPDGEWHRQIQSANNLLNAGDFAGAEDVYRRELLQAESVGDNLRAALMLQNLGVLLYRRGDSLAAEKTYLRAIDTLSRSEVRDDGLARRIWVTLSALYIQTSRHSKAEPLIRRLLNDQNVPTADKANLMVSLGVVLANKRQLSDAGQLFRDASELCEGASENELQQVEAVAIANMAGVQMQAGETDEALASYRRALAAMETIPNLSPVPLAVMLGEYAGVLRSIGDRKESENLYRKAIALAETRLGPKHAILGMLLQQYSELLEEAGRKSEARNQAKASEQIRIESDRENLTGYTVSLQELGSHK